MLEEKGTLRTAGSRFITYGGASLAWRWALILCIKVVLPEPEDCVSFEVNLRVEIRYTSHADTDNGDGRCLVRRHCCWCCGVVDGGFVA